MKTRRSSAISVLAHAGQAARLLGLSLLCGAAGAYESGRAGFAVEINSDLVVPYRVFAIYVLPGERLVLRSPVESVVADTGLLTRESADAWRWIAPAAPELAVLRFNDGRDEIRLNAFVLHPASAIADGELFGYRIGEYPEPLGGDPVYDAPEGYIELTSDLQDVELSPHFTLGQFPSKQSTALPKYLVLREELLLKLELLLERLNDSGVAAESLTVMSGYRTPMYNRAIGNGQHSRHVYGGAADVYVDVSPRDGIMDDLNGDGRFDYRDAQWLYRLADELVAQPAHARLRGGLGVYRSNAAHGPFLHVDARGRRARWGLLP